LRLHTKKICFSQVLHITSPFCGKAVDWNCLPRRQIQLCLSIYKDCDVTAIVVKLVGGGKYQLFRFEIEGGILQQELFYKGVILLFLDAAGAVADFTLRFYNFCCGVEQIVLCFGQLLYRVWL